MDTLNLSQPVNDTSATINTMEPKTKSRGFLSKNFIGMVIALVVIVLGVIFLPKLIIKPGTITITGTGKMTAIPESVSLIVTKVNVASDPTAAIVSGDVALNALINQTKSIVGQDVVIEKTFYSTALTTTGLQVANGFKATFKNVSKVNDLIKALYNYGATSISSITFIPVDKEKVSQEVNKLAIDDANNGAKNMAKLLGKRLGRVVSATDDQSQVGSSVTSNNGEVGSGEIDITKTITVIYEIW